MTFDEDHKIKTIIRYDVAQNILYLHTFLRTRVLAYRSGVLRE